MKILIDGYNLIFECGLHGKTVNSHSLAQARNRLLQRLAVVFSGREDQVTVVFDAQRQMLSGNQERATFHGITVLYSLHFTDADEMIEDLIQKHSAPKSLTVVSSDHRLHKSAGRRKSRAVDSGEWWDSLESPEAHLPVHPESKPFDPTEPLLSKAELERFKDAVEDDLEDMDTDWM